MNELSGIDVTRTPAELAGQEQTNSGPASRPAERQTNICKIIKPAGRHLSAPGNPIAAIGPARRRLSRLGARSLLDNSGRKLECRQVL